MKGLGDFGKVGGGMMMIKRTSTWQEAEVPK
jgi:hypothetical protein